MISCNLARSGGPKKVVRKSNKVQTVANELEKEGGGIFWFLCWERFFLTFGLGYGAKASGNGTKTAFLFFSVRFPCTSRNSTLLRLGFIIFLQEKLFPSFPLLLSFEYVAYMMTPTCICFP